MDTHPRTRQWHFIGRYSGALIGGLIFVGLPEAARWVNGGAFAQSSSGGSSTSGAGQPLNLPGASGNFNFNQRGGTNYQTYINPVPEKLKFTAALGTELLAKIPKDKPLTIEAIGSNSDRSVGRQIYDFLNANGYQTQLREVGMRAPPPDRPLTYDPAASVLTVAPSVR